MPEENDFSQEREQTQLVKREKAAELAKTINYDDPKSLASFGLDQQEKLSKYSNQILNNIRTKDTGEAGEAIVELLQEIGHLNSGEINSGQSFLAKLPIIGKLVDKSNNFLTKAKSIEDNLDTIIDRMAVSRKNLIEDNAHLGELKKNNFDYIQEMEVVIEAGEISIAAIAEKIKEKSELLKETPDDIQLLHEIQELESAKTRLEKKNHDFGLTKNIAMQTLPQIRVIEESNAVIVEKIQSTVNNTIPLWRNQIALAIALKKQKKVIDTQKALDETTKKMLEENAAGLKMNSIAAAKANEEGIIDVDTLKKVNTDLISTLTEIRKIKTEGSAKRRKAEAELKKLETEMYSKASLFLTSSESETKTRLLSD